MLSSMLQHIQKGGQKPPSQLLHCSVVSLAEVIIESKSRKTKKEMEEEEEEKEGRGVRQEGEEGGEEEEEGNEWSPLRNQVERS